MSSNIACSVCYGTGYGVNGKPCPCGCRAAPLPAAQATESIADDPEFKKLASELWASRQDSMLAAFNNLARYIDTRLKGEK
jgi:hypothetical protein